MGSSVASPGELSAPGGRTANGFFKRWVGAATGTADFPVGSLADSKPVSINFTAAPSTGGSLTAGWITGNAGFDGLPLTEGTIAVSKISNEGYWRVTAADGLSGGTYTGTFTANNIKGVTDRTELVLLKRADSSSPWTLDGTHITTTGSDAAPVLSRSGMTGFSDFSIGSSSLNALPVRLMNFTAFKSGKVNRLQWSTATEQNNKGFEIQRSSDGQIFTALAFIPSKAAGGNSVLKLDYSVDDEMPLKGNCYYRLKQIDKDGRYEFSRIFLLKGADNDEVVISNIYPIPAVKDLNVVINSSSAEKLQLNLTDINGKTLHTRSVNVIRGENLLNIDVAHLPAGTYFIVMKGNKNKNKTQKFIKQ